MARADLTVMGAGVFGLSVAWAAARRGARVRVVEAAHVGAGASGGVVGALMPHAPGGKWDAARAFQLDSLRMAPGWWADAEARSGLSAGYAPVGRLSPLADGRAVEAARAGAAAAADRWGPGFGWQVVPAGPGWGPVSPTGLWLHETLSARVSPRAALAVLVAALKAEGSTVEEGVTLPDPEGPTVWATGQAGLAPFGGGPVRGQAARLALDAGAVPLVHAPGLFVVPHADGSVAVGSTDERDRLDPASDERLEEVIARARALVPALAGAPVIERWAGLRPRAAHGRPLLGPWPGRPGWFVANGGFKTGFGLAPLVGEVMADLVLEGRDRVPEGFAAAPRAVRPDERPRPASPPDPPRVPAPRRSPPAGGDRGG